MEIRVLRYFFVTAREQNITKAAELLHITQPTLSRQLAALEEELGTSLFIRGNKKITLTEKGHSAASRNPAGEAQCAERTGKLVWQGL